MAQMQRRRPESKPRAIRIGRREIAGGIEIRAECDDETTSVVVLNPGAVFPEGLPLTEELQRALLKEHLLRCESCQRWAA
jgi:hypothetical protein